MPSARGQLALHRVARGLARGGEQREDDPEPGVSNMQFLIVMRGMRGKWSRDGHANDGSSIAGSARHEERGHHAAFSAITM